MPFDAHLQTLAGARAALRLALAHRDRRAPKMAETRELEIATPHGPLPARLYVPASAPTPSAALLFWHGGGFVFCDVETHDALCRRLAAAAGLHLLSAGYRLAPEAPFPAQIEDGIAAARYVATHAPELRVEGERLLVGGDSAGAYIAVSVALALQGDHIIDGQALLYPLLQLDDARWAATLFADTRFAGRLAVAYIRAQLKAADLAIPSLIESASPRSPPTLVVTGGQLDPVRPDARAYADNLDKAGVPVWRLEYPALPHGFGNFTHVLAGAASAVTEIGRNIGALARR